MGANAVGMSTLPPATTESGDRDRSSKKHIIFLKSGSRKFYCLTNSNASYVYTNWCTVLTSDKKSILLICIMVLV